MTSTHFSNGVSYAWVVVGLIVFYNGVSGGKVIGTQGKNSTIPGVVLLFGIGINVEFYVALEKRVSCNQVFHLLCIASHIYSTIDETHVNAQAQGVGETLPLT